jgi:hypothetical protein
MPEWKIYELLVMWNWEWPQSFESSHFSTTVFSSMPPTGSADMHRDTL